MRVKHNAPRGWAVILAVCVGAACDAPPATVVTPPRRIAAGFEHACAIRSDGRVLCWGNNTKGQLGDGTLTDSHTPVLVSGLRDVVEVGAGDNFSCALLRDGTVSCWGALRQFFVGTDWQYDRYPTPVRIEGVTRARTLRVSAGTACTLDTAGTVWCWGQIREAGAPVTSVNRNLEPRAVTEVSPADHLVVLGSIGGGVCGRSPRGEVRCVRPGFNAPTDLPRVPGDFWSNGMGICFRDQEMNLVCTGEPLPGAGLQRTPVRVEGATGAVAYPELRGALDLVEYRYGEGFCAVMPDGGLKCSGRSSPEPTYDLGALRPALTAVRGVAVGAAFACALHGDDRVTCWGDNSSGALGAPNYSTTLVDVPGLSDAVALSEGPTEYSCAVRSGGSVVCWGDNGRGQLGVGHNGRVSGFVALPGIMNATSVSTAKYSTCAMLQGDEAICWGRDGATRSSMSRRWEEVSRVIDEVVQTRSGILRIRNSPLPADAPLEVPVRSFALHGETLAMIRANGNVKLWARGDLGTSWTSFVEEQEYRLDAVEATVGERHACARRADGAVLCWGESREGQLGFISPSGEPLVQVDGVGRAVQISAGGWHTCALRDDATVACWGSNSHGQLGDGTTATPDGPVVVRGLRDAVEVRAGSRHTCARRRGGTVACWGFSERDTLGVAGTVRATWSLPR